jgi:YfiH family protein
MYTSRLLSRAGFVHAFFSRNGGVSAGPFASLNTSDATGDSPDLVEANLRRVAEALGMTRTLLLFAHQVHGARILSVNRYSDTAQVQQEQADGLTSNDPEVACAVRVADCAPVLIADQRSGAVVAVHSGWRGTVQRIVPAAIHVLRQMSQQPALVAAVGPHLEACCFEVGEDVAEQIASCSGADRDAVVLPGQADRPHADLRAVLHAQLLESGLREEDIDHVRGCTYCGVDQFYSYRRDGARSGRLIAAIRPRTGEPAPTGR